jgi:hypothetical protein
MPRRCNKSNTRPASAVSESEVRVMGKYQQNTAQSGDALTLLQSLPECTPLVWFDPQFRGVLDKLDYGNEGARQKGRFKLPPMSADYIDACCREAARVLMPSGYLMRWTDTFHLGICRFWCNCRLNYSSTQPC